MLKWTWGLVIYRGSATSVGTDVLLFPVDIRLCKTAQDHNAKQLLNQENNAR